MRKRPSACARSNAAARNAKTSWRETTDQPDERQAHERRADKADYLREKLEEQSDAPDAPDE